MASSRFTLASALLFALLVAAPAAAAPGDLDPSFGTYGKYLSPTDGDSTAENVVVAPDGTILVGGNTFPVEDRFRATISRFTAAGEPDPSFGQDGLVALPSTSGDASVALQGEKIIATAAADFGGSLRLAVFRLQPDGTLDPSFGTAGVADTGLPASSTPQLAITQDQKIIVSVGSAPIPGVIIARLLADGKSFDPEFGGGVVYADASVPASVQAMAAGPGDEVTVLVQSFYAQAASRVLRFRNDGSPDPGFGTDGVAEVQPGGSPTYLYDMALRPNGSLVAVGSPAGQSSEGLIVSLTSTGDPDPAFGGDGLAAVPTQSFDLLGVGLDDAGRVLATGSGIGPLRTQNLLLARYLPDGSPDPAFGTNGQASAIFGRQWTRGQALAIATDGRIVVAAERITGFRSNHYVLGLMRFLVSDGPRDPDADGVLRKRDKCPQLGGKPRHRGCPLIEREVELTVRRKGIKGAVEASSGCDGVGKAAIFGVEPGRDDLFGRVTIRKSGRFSASLGPGFTGRVYVRLGRNINPIAGLCGSAKSNTVSVG